MLREMLPTPIRSCLRTVKQVVKAQMDEWPIFDPKGVNHFVIISHPRSGSNFFRDILNQHPDVLEVGEYLHRDPVVSLETLNDVIFKNRQRDPNSSLSEYLPPCDDSGHLLDLSDVGPCLDKLAGIKHAKKVGFALFPQVFSHQLGNEEACRLARMGNMRVLFLIRRNLLQSYVSIRRAAVAGVWHTDAAGRLIQHPHTATPADALKRPIGPIDIEDANRWIGIAKEYLSSVERTLQAHHKRYCTVYYEDLCLGKPGQTLREVNRVLKFLHVSKMEKYTPHFSKTTPSNVYQTIPNREEVAAATGYSL
jgi:hypothetical protein